MHFVLVLVCVGHKIAWIKQMGVMDDKQKRVGVMSVSGLKALKSVQKLLIALTKLKAISKTSLNPYITPPYTVPQVTKLNY